MLENVKNFKFKLQSSKNCLPFHIDRSFFKHEITATTIKSNAK